MEYSFLNKYVEIQGYKHDGRMHRIWDSPYCVYEDSSYIVLCSNNIKVIEHDFRVWYTKEPAVMLFFKNRWMNIVAMFKKNGLTYYVNLASPYIVDNSIIKYIDYDLDIKLFPNNKIRLIDVKEYALNKKIYDYSEDINTILKFNVEEINSLMKKREFPFNDDIIKEYYEKYKAIKGKKDE